MKFPASPIAVKYTEAIEIQDIPGQIKALPDAGSPQRRTLNYFSTRCVLATGIALVASVTGIIAAVVAQSDPKVRLALCLAGGTAIFASCLGLSCRAMSVLASHRNEAAQPLLPHREQIQMSNSLQNQPQPVRQTERERLFELQQNFQELLREAPPFFRSRPEVLDGAMQIALEDSILH